MASEYIKGFPGNWKTPSAVGSRLTLFDLDERIVNPSNLPTFGSRYSGTITVINKSGSKEFTFNEYGQIQGDNAFVVEIGENEVFYNVSFDTITAGDPATSSVEKSYIKIYGVENKYPLKPWTNEAVIERLLDLTEPIRKTEKPRFTFRLPGEKRTVAYTANVSPKILTVSGTYSLADIANGVDGEIIGVEWADEAYAKTKFATVTLDYTKDTVKLMGTASKQGGFTIGLNVEVLVYNENANVFKQFAPEYTMTRMNLRECLQMIGGRVHAEPRLQNGNEIGFDFYGGQEYAKITNYRKNTSKKICDYKHTVSKGRYDIEQTCTRLESYMDNFVNRVNWEEATVGQPFESYTFGQTLRTTEYARIGEDDGYFFETAYPIDRPVLLEAKTPTTGKWVPITGFLYEKTVYDNLSGYNNYAPAKAFALYYTQGESGIKGFFYKVPNATGGVYDNYSIVNVVEAVSGEKITDYVNMEFRLTYVPIYSARVTHGKQYVSDYISLPRALNHSQSYNSVETRFYGQNIKATAQRMGNIEQFYTFVVRNVENIPKAGTLWDDNYYISTVSVAVGFDLFEVTVGVSKNFNRKSQYIGASSYKRIYEVSEKMVTERNSLYQDYVVIRDIPETEREKSVTSYLSATGADFLLKDMFVSGSGRYDVDCEVAVAQVITCSQSENALHGVLLPVICSSFGNVIEFSWEMKDNFSAGTRMDGATTTGNDGTYVFGFGTEYGDYYGRAYYMDFHLFSKTQIDGIFEKNDTAIEYTTAKSYPLAATESYSVLSMAKGDKILLRKDSREALRFGYAIEFVADGEAFIIGQALTEKNPLVTPIAYTSDKTNKMPHLYLLPFKINKYADSLTQTQLSQGLDLGVYDGEYTSGLTTRLDGVAYTGDTVYQSWAYVFPVVQGEAYTVSNENGTAETYTPTIGGDIVLAKNVEIKNGDTVGAFEAMTVHDIFEYLKTKK